MLSRNAFLWKISSISSPSWKSKNMSKRIKLIHTVLPPFHQKPCDNLTRSLQQNLIVGNLFLGKRFPTYFYNYRNHAINLQTHMPSDEMLVAHNCKTLFFSNHLYTKRQVSSRIVCCADRLNLGLSSYRSACQKCFRVYADYWQCQTCISFCSRHRWLKRIEIVSIPSASLIIQFAFVPFPFRKLSAHLRGYCFHHLRYRLCFTSAPQFAAPASHFML